MQHTSLHPRQHEHHHQFAQPCAYEKQFMDLVCIRFEQHRLHAREPPAHHAAFGCSTMAVANGHTASNTPDPIRTRKLSGARPGQYWGGGPPGKSLGCCWLFVVVEGRSRWSSPALLLFVYYLRTYFSGTGILAEGAIALPVTLSGGALFAS